MKIILERKKLLESITRVHAIVEKRNIMPILEHVKIDICNGEMSLTTTDLDVTIRDQFKVDFDNDVSFTVSVQQIYDITKKLSKSDYIEIDFDKLDSGQIEISAGQSKVTLPCLSSQEFPSFDVMENYSSFEITSYSLRKILLKTRHAMSSGDMRHYLNGINLKTDNDLLIAAATDVHRLAISSISKPDDLDVQDGIIVPKKTIAEIIKMTEQLKDDELVTVNISENKISLQVNNTTLVSKLINGKYPNYSGIFAIKPDKMFSIDMTELENAVELVSTIADGKIKIVNITLLDNILTVSSDSNKDGKHSTARQEILVESSWINESGNKIDSRESLSIGFMLNAKYLLDVLNVCNGPRIHFNLSSSSAPVIVKDTADLTSQYVLMPMQLDTGS